MTRAEIEARFKAALKAAQEALSDYQRAFAERPPFTLDGPLLELPQALLDECRVLQNRRQLLGRLTKGGVLGEVGTLHGDFATEIMEIAAPSTLHVIDLSFDNLSATNKERLERSGCRFHRGDSATVLASFPENYFDFLYIDARHSYEAVRRDLDQAGRVVKKGGLIACNDYTLIDIYRLLPYGVVQATNAFAVRTRSPMVYFVLQVSGFHDVVLRTS